MKQKLFLGLSLLAMAGLWTGCSNDEAIDMAADGQAISFRVQGGTPDLRTTATTIANLDAFVVYGTDDAATANIFDKITVAKVAGTTTFEYSPKKYYSVGAEVANFVAYSPVSSTITATSVDDLETTATFDYTVAKPSAISGNTTQEDLLISGVSIGEAGTTLTSGSVVLNFKHALARVFVKATNALDETVVIKGLTLKNLYATGTLTGTPVAESPWKWAWSETETDGLDDLGDFAYVLAPTGVAVPSGTGIGTGASAALVTSIEQGMMILPQPVVNGGTSTISTLASGDFALEVFYDVANLKDQTAYILIDNDATDGLPAFEMGKQYAITVSFDATTTNLIDISFTVTVDDFDDANIVDAPLQ